MFPIKVTVWIHICLPQHTPSILFFAFVKQIYSGFFLSFSVAKCSQTACHLHFIHFFPFDTDLSDGFLKANSFSEHSNNHKPLSAYHSLTCVIITGTVGALS